MPISILHRLLLLLVVLAPLPLGSNREWSWTLCAFIVAVISLGWAMYSLLKPQSVSIQLDNWGQRDNWGQSKNSLKGPQIFEYHFGSFYSDPNYRGVFTLTPIISNYLNYLQTLVIA